MRKIFIFLCAAALTVVSVFIGLKGDGQIAFAELNDNEPFETYEDYQTALGRDGEKTKLEQMIDFIRTGEKNVVSTAEIVDETIPGGGNKSLKISNGDISNMTAFYSNGTLTNNDQSGAKYMKIYIKNLSGADKGLGFYYTDIPQQTIDGTAPKVDYGQEHWALKYNAYVMLETTSGEKLALRSDAGLYVVIPKDFEGSISIPINSNTLELPGWYIKAMPPASNGIIELERTYMISPVIPNLMPDTVFLIGDMYFKSDSNVDEYLSQFKQQEAENIKDIVKTTSDNLTIDYVNLTIAVNKNATISELLDMLYFKDSSYEITINDIDGFPLQDDDAITDGSVLKINNSDMQYSFTVNIKTESNNGCSGEFFNTNAIIYVAFIFVGLFAVRRKINEENK